MWCSRPGKTSSSATGRGILSMQGLSYGVVRVDSENSLTSLTLQDCGQVMPGGQYSCCAVFLVVFGGQWSCRATVLVMPGGQYLCVSSLSCSEVSGHAVLKSLSCLEVSIYDVYLPLFCQEVSSHVL